MSYFNVNKDRMQTSSDAFIRLARTLSSYSSTLTSINSNLGINSAARTSLRRALRNVSNQIIDEAASMHTLSDALNTIANEYQRAEEKLLGYATFEQPEIDYVYSGEKKEGFWDNIKKKIAKIREEIRYWLVDHGIIKAERQERVEGQPVTERQEHEMDLYMKQEVTKIRKEERFSEETWRNATVEERKKILQDYLDRIYEIMGLPRVELEWADVEQENGYALMGYYSDDTRSVTINEWMIREGDANSFNSYELIPTIAHEMRHYYQKEAIRNPDKYVVTEETIQAWEESFANYRDQSGFERDFGMTPQEAFEAYQNQTVEVDARWYEGAE